MQIDNINNSASASRFLFSLGRHCTCSCFSASSAFSNPTDVFFRDRDLSSRAQQGRQRLGRAQRRFCSRARTETPRKVRRLRVRCPVCAMVQPYFIAAPVGLGALVLQRTFRRKKGPRDEEVRRRDGDGDDTAFACERVCSSDRLIKRLGYLSKVRAETRRESCQISDASNQIF